MAAGLSNARILIVTPELSYLPEGMANNANAFSAKAGGLADVSAALISALYHLGADVHVALPDYRSIFNGCLSPADRKLDLIKQNLPEERIHLAQDVAFFYRNRVYSKDSNQNIKISLAFQREVIQNIVPRVQPDLIHCNDWMTGLIPPMARQFNIPSLFSIHNIHTVHRLLYEIEDRGIDVASFWKNFYYETYPTTYSDTRDSNSVDFLASGVFGAHFVNTVSPTFLSEIVQGRHHLITDALRQEMVQKEIAGCAIGILNAPDSSFNPAGDNALERKYAPENHQVGKRVNKLSLQKKMGLLQDPQAPLFFWPSRLDPFQKGCELLAEILYETVSRYWHDHLQIIFVADGPFQQHFKEIANFHGLLDRVAVYDFNEQLSRLAYGAADFILMPSSFEPCGLPQMIGAIYGTLPIGHDIGGLHDTVLDLNVSKNEGNGFLFKTFDQQGLSWAIDQAMNFFKLPITLKQRQIRRIMVQSLSTFSHDITAKRYIELYEEMLQRPLIQGSMAA